MIMSPKYLVTLPHKHRTNDRGHSRLILLFSFMGLLSLFSAIGNRTSAKVVWKRINWKMWSKKSSGVIARRNDQFDSVSSMPGDDRFYSFYSLKRRRQQTFQLGTPQIETHSIESTRWTLPVYGIWCHSHWEVRFS